MDPFSIYTKVSQKLFDAVPQMSIRFSLFITQIDRQALGYIFLVLSIICFLSFGMKKWKWVESKPDQWLVVIRNGKMVKAGVGIKAFQWFFQTTVKFPCKIKKVSFEAKNVTIQMQGIIVKGFIFWSVYRDEDGPFRFYKYMRSLNPSTSVQALSESVLRNLISNSTMNEVVKNRAHIRNTLIKELKDQLKGWGIWLESIEITDVRICSINLFQDLQAEFRQQTNQKALMGEISRNQSLFETKHNSQMRIFQKQELNESKRIKNQMSEEIKRKTHQFDYFMKQSSIQKEKIIRERELQMIKIKFEKEKGIEELKKKQQNAKKQLQFRAESLKQKIQMDKLHNDQTLKKYKIDSTERIYNSLIIKNLAINSYGQKNLAQLLPTLKNA